MTPTVAELATSPVQQVLVACTLYASGEVAATPAVVGGSVTADGRRSILRDAQIDFAPTDDLTAAELYELLVTPGVTIGLERGWRLPDGTELLVGLGRFVPDTPELKRDAAGWRVSTGATDVAIKVQRARWTDPYQVASGTALATALSELLQDRYPQISTRITTDLCPETMGSGLVTEAGDGTDPWSDAVNLAGAYGYALYPDTSGVVTVRKISPATDAPSFTFARGAAAVVTELTKSSPLERTYNGVIATGEGSELETPVRGEAWDDNPSSPTYRYGPFGKVPYFYSSSLMTTADQCEQAAAKILAAHLGRVEDLSWRSAVHPGLQPWDVVGLEEEDGSVTSYLLDSVTIPLDVGGTMEAVAREISVSY